YVSLCDWEKISPQQLLEAISENTEKENKIRKSKGFSALHVIGWLLEPTLDRNTNTVFWAIEGVNEGYDEHIANSVALRLGRYGYEKIVWVTDKDSYTPFGGELDIMLRAHSFDCGHKYSDFSKGDKIASYGIATLVAATVGGKIAKVGGLAVVFKKLGGVIAAGLGAVFYKLRRIFRRRKDR
ncbi:MAG: DUF2167 domain-containing protein, partial [Chlamydiales bacterium]